MCIIIAKRPSAQHPTDEVIDECWKRNPHGAGYAFANADGGVTVRKGFMTLEALKASLEEVRSVNGSWYIIHFRIATHGSKGPENTHPFWVTNGKVAMAHNGMLPIGDLVKDDEGRSDTAAFAEDILSKLPDGWHRHPAFVHMVEEYMGRGNKIAVIDHDGIELFNLSAWNEDKETGLFYSNYAWKVYKSEYTTPVYSHQSGGATSTENFRTPTRQGNAQHGVHGAGGTPTLSNKSAKKKAASTLGKRLGSMVQATLISVAEASALKQLATHGEYDPEEVEDFLDFYVEMHTAMPGLTLDGLFISMQARDLPDAINQVLEMQFGDRHTDTVQLEYDSDAEAITSSRTLAELAEEPCYNSENCECFVGLNVKLTLDINGSEEYRFCRVIALEDKGYGDRENSGFQYEMLVSGNMGWVSFDATKKVEGLLTITKPSAATLGQFIGAKVFLQTDDGKTCPAVIGDEAAEDPGYWWFQSVHAPFRWKTRIDSIVKFIVEELGDKKELANKA